MIVGTSSLTLPEDAPFRRAMLRAPQFRQPGYETAYDGRTLFYDAFRHGDDVVLSGPPLLNMRRRFGSARFLSDGDEAAASLTDINRTQRSRLLGARGEEVRIILDGLDEALAVSPDGRGLFRGRRVLFAISRNNRLEWITDWLRYYARIHEIDGVLLYDNGSDAYSLEELDAAIGGVAGISVSAVVNWPFPFGPGAGPNKVWDSDYCHASMFEHARFRFLEQAQQVVNADIDELIVTADGRPLHAHLSSSESGGLIYRGRWIEGDPAADNPRFLDFDRYDSARPPCAKKWTIRPNAVPDSAQWSNHGFVGWAPDQALDVWYGHFRLITTNWKYNRLKLRDDENWVQDVELRGAMDRAFAQ
jgi:hypothetical protein